MEIDNALAKYSRNVVIIPVILFHAISTADETNILIMPPLLLYYVCMFVADVILMPAGLWGTKKPAVIRRAAALLSVYLFLHNI